MKRRFSNPHGMAILFLGVLLILLVISSFGISAELQRFTDCNLIEMKGSDGDSFKVEFADGSQRVLRLYGVDCIESKIWDEADGRRLIEQRSYFGIRGYGSNSGESIALAKKYGSKAHSETVKMLSKPFTVHTSFADGRGSGYHKRIYAFVTTNSGVDLGSHLVEVGLARAHGVRRQTPRGDSRDEMEMRLLDLEFKAAQQRSGVWAYTDWDDFAEQRAKRRAEDLEVKLALDKESHTSIVDPNTAPRDQLMTIQGVGEKIALRIIESRPYQNAGDLLKVKGLGETTLKSISVRLPKQFHLPDETNDTES